MRHWLWLPYDWVLLTLPNDLGEYRGHEIRRCPQQRILADNIAIVRCQQP